MSDDRTNRRWFRFSLRTLFVVVAVGCLLLWYFKPWVPVVLRAYGVSQTDFSRFSYMVATDSRIKIKQLVRIEIPVPGEAKLITGDPLDRSSISGDEIDLRMRDGVWVITAIRPRTELRDNP